MLKSYQDQRQILHPGGGNVPFGVRHLRPTVSQISSESITRDNEDADIDLSPNDGLPQMNQVNDEQIAPC